MKNPIVFWWFSDFLELGNFNKHSPTTQERKALQWKNIRFFRLENLKHFIVNDKSGFDLTTRASYFTILVSFTNHIYAENTYFTNHIERTEPKI